MAFQTLVRWPPPLQAQRRVTAAAYRVLAEVATAAPDASTLPAAAALDGAQEGLSPGALFGDPALTTLRTLVNEGLRMRVQLLAIRTLLRPEGFPRAELDPALRQRATDTLALTGQALEQSARVIEGDDDGAARLVTTVAAITTASAGLGATDEAANDGADLSRATQIARRFVALSGQLRAVTGLASAAAAGGGLRSRRPQRRTSRPLERLRADLDTLRANASLESLAGRHAVRLAVVVPLAELLARELPLNRSYWVVVAAATALRPEFGATLTRGTERAVGTCLGVAMAGAIAALLHPAGGVTVAIVALLAWAGYAVFPASFAAGFTFITALVVFLLNAISPDTFSTASARLLDTLIGGVLGLLVYALWPTWSQTPARRALAQLVSAQRAYITHVLDALAAGRRPADDKLRTQARQARLARTNADAVVAQALNDPASRRIDPHWSQSVLAALRRLVQAAHILRLDVQEARERRPLPGLARVSAVLNRLLTVVEHRLESEPQPDAEGSAVAAPDLRGAFVTFERGCGQDVAVIGLLAELDEIVDAANGLAALVGADPSAGPPPGPT